MVIEGTGSCAEARNARLPNTLVCKLVFGSSKMRLVSVCVYFHHTLARYDQPMIFRPDWSTRSRWSIMIADFIRLVVDFPALKMSFAAPLIGSELHIP
jgi:hypothetical protein